MAVKITLKRRLFFLGIEGAYECRYLRKSKDIFDI